MAKKEISTQLELELPQVLAQGVLSTSPTFLFEAQTPTVITRIDFQVVPDAPSP